MKNISQKSLERLATLLRVEVKMAITYQCCFCGKMIKSQLPDVGGLLYTTAIDGPAECRNAQQFYVVDLPEIDESVTIGEPLAPGR